jgi:predicted ribosome quality control (RQC) complex YloA/Tae2 family protein
MSLNWKEIEKILAELPLEGCHIQGIRQPDFRSLVLELFRPGDAWNLYVNLGAGASRLHRLSRRLPYPKVSQRFVEFLRSRVRGGRITQVRQIPGDRLFSCTVYRAGEETLLWFRLWGAASNIIAVNGDAVILDAYYRRPGRGEETGGFYRPSAPESSPEKPARNFELRPYPQDRPFGAFIEEEYFRGEEEELRKKLLARLQARLTLQEAKILATIAGLEQRRAGYEGLQQMSRSADLIMQNLHALKKGDLWCKARDYETGADIEILLDPALSPRENALVLYQKYKKAKNGLGVVEEELANLRAAREGFARRREELLRRQDLRVLQEELRGLENAREKEKSAAAGLSFTSGVFRIHVGRTAEENDKLLRRHVNGGDYWLHTRDCPGAYVFVKCPRGKTVPLETLLDAGNLAVFYSKARSSGSAELYYTQVKYLRRAKGEKPGTVLPTHEKNLSIRLDPRRLERLQNPAE